MLFWAVNCKPASERSSNMFLGNFHSSLCSAGEWNINSEKQAWAEKFKISHKLSLFLTPKMNCIEDCSNAFLFQCCAAGGSGNSYRVLKPLKEDKLPAIALLQEKTSLVCPLPHCRCVSNILWASGNVYLWMGIKQWMWMFRDISVLCRNPAPLKKWDLSHRNALGPKFL